MVKPQSKDYSRARSDMAEKPYLNPAGSLAKIINLAKHKKRILDIGCADGSLGQYLKDFDCHITGVDISIDMLSIAKNYCDESHVIDLDNEDISNTLEDKVFDVIVCADVLEHLKNPSKILLQIKKLLKSDGFIIASIPNIAHGAIRLSLLQGKFEYQDLGILDNTHLRFFTRSSVIPLFESAGYTAQIVDVTKYPIFGGNLVPLVKSQHFSNQLIEQIKASSDSEVLQFIVKAIPGNTVLPTLNEDREESKPQEEYAAAYPSSSILEPQIGKSGGTLESQLQEAKARLQDLKLQLHELKIKHDATQTDLEKTIEQLQETQNKLSQIENKLSQAETKLSQTETKLSQTETKLSQTETKLENTEVKAQKISKDLSSARLTINNMKATVAWKVHIKIARLKTWVYGIVRR
ncbi:methyltransferase type 11 [Leptolyngbya sp. Heron Island J]|uniref:methyltransferase domain-containing protein n=1 Tax=Leptolyngbya sp. Heron Island J TaxID=1385935 RepID=UPI0003B9846F|nr:methyltransferase domain-containing protein [Leptolyngbya sp. Heron Island J]ESA33022.1 methyltransferase type 11 [Leptolyngbya sp. Heron Island J]